MVVNEEHFLPNGERNMEKPFKVSGIIIDMEDLKTGSNGEYTSALVVPLKLEEIKTLLGYTEQLGKYTWKKPIDIHFKENGSTEEKERKTDSRKYKD